MTFFNNLGVTVPIVQAPMAGVSTPELAAAVSNAGGLGSIGVGATNAAGARAMIKAIRSKTDRAFNVNVFVHNTAIPNPQREAAWINAMRPLFQKYDSEQPTKLHTIYKSLLEDESMFELLVEAAPPVVSFHFGIPNENQIQTLKDAGCRLIATATNLTEAQFIERAGIDAIVAQGYEAGGHRGVFNPDAPDEMLNTMALTRALINHVKIPIISAGGIMNGADVRSAIDIGAIGAQLGTAFIACPESSADSAYRAALQGNGAKHTVMTKAISGRPARSLANLFTKWGAETKTEVPDYPIAYAAGKALNQAARSIGETGFSAQWAGTGAPRHRPMPAADLLALIVHEAN